MQGRFKFYSYRNKIRRNTLGGPPAAAYNANKFCISLLQKKPHDNNRFYGQLGCKLETEKVGPQRHGELSDLSHSKNWHHLQKGGSNALLHANICHL